MGLFVDISEDVLDCESGILTDGVGKDIHEIEVHGVNQGSLFHPKTTFLERILFGRWFIWLHDEFKSTWHSIDTLVIDCFKYLQKLWWASSTQVQNVLVEQKLKRLVWGVDVVSIVRFGLMINDHVEVEWYDVVTDPETVVQMVSLVPFSEQMLVLHSQIIVSNLRQTDSIV